MLWKCSSQMVVLLLDRLGVICYTTAVVVEALRVKVNMIGVIFFHLVSECREDYRV